MKQDRVLKIEAEEEAVGVDSVAVEIAAVKAAEEAAMAVVVEIAAVMAVVEVVVAEIAAAAAEIAAVKVEATNFRCNEFHFLKI